MFDIRKRKAFQTVGELRALLNRLPAYADVYICGDANCFFHEQADRSSILIPLISTVSRSGGGR